MLNGMGLSEVNANSSGIVSKFFDDLILASSIFARKYSSCFGDNLLGKLLTNSLNGKAQKGMDNSFSGFFSSAPTLLTLLVAPVRSE